MSNQNQDTQCITKEELALVRARLQAIMDMRELERLSQLHLMVTEIRNLRGVK